ncbi:MAG: sugar ABC transporter permease [Desulfobacterales bacterium]
MVAPAEAGLDARTRRGPRGLSLALMLLPALAVVVLLFGGGLALGVLQALGYLPGAGLTRLSGGHFARVLSDPDFFLSLGMTLYISVVSTLLAAGISIVAALVLDRMAGRYRSVHFIFQLPLTVPHLVIAVALIFMLAPAGLLARSAVAVGLIQTPAEFPLLVNDRWSIGIILTYVWKEIPFITLMLLAVLRNAGRDLIDVGRTLKAGAWQRFRHITLPTIFPALGAASLIVFAFTFGAFEVPYLLGRTYPMTLPVRAYKHYSDIDLMARPEGIATGLLIALVVAVAVVTAQALTRAARRRGIVI